VSGAGYRQQLSKTLHNGKDDDMKNRHASILKRQHV
jgi:hypothetical protein